MPNEFLRKDVTPGKRFHKFVAVKYLETIENEKSKKTHYWLCECDCGKEFRVSIDSICQGQKTCGCLRSTSISTATFARTRHGMYKSREYTSWESMMARCYNKNHHAYKNYGGRGIIVCERWLDFALFYEDMGNRPSGRFSLDRIEINGDYCKENCKWSNDFEQARNRRDSVYFELNGERKTIPEWAEITGIRRETLRGRLQHGWPVDVALTYPVGTSHGKQRKWKIS